MHFIFFIGFGMNYKPNPSIDLEFQPFLAVGQKKNIFDVFFGKTAVKISIFVQFLKVRYQNVWNKLYSLQKILKFQVDI